MTTETKAGFTQEQAAAMHAALKTIIRSITLAGDDPELIELARDQYCLDIARAALSQAVPK
jgi:hypothetical protein